MIFNYNNIETFYKYINNIVNMCLFTIAFLKNIEKIKIIGLVNRKKSHNFNARPKITIKL